METNKQEESGFYQIVPCVIKNSKSSLFSQQISVTLFFLPIKIGPCK